MSTVVYIPDSICLLLYLNAMLKAALANPPISVVGRRIDVYHAENFILGSVGCSLPSYAFPTSCVA